MVENHRHEYSESDDSFIAKNYGKMPIQEIAKIIGTSKSGISHRAQRIGVLVKQVKKPTLYDGIDLPAEEWRDVIGYEGFYQVSNLGRIKSLDRTQKMPPSKFPPSFVRKGKTIKQHIDKNGYCQACLSANGKKKRWPVHRLVAMAFIPNVNLCPHINHKDENKQNNNADNLEWCTAKYNNSYGSRLKRMANAEIGERNHGHKLNEADVLYARSVYVPYHSKYGAAALARRFGVTQSTMCSAINGKSWSCLGTSQSSIN